MKTLSTNEMRLADHRCIHELGIPSAVLMENAGRAVFTQITTGPIGIVCGKGNNGGDGFVVARHCLLAGWQTSVILLAEPESLTGDAATYMNVYRKLGGLLIVTTDEVSVRKAVAELSNCTTLVDAILGTGVKGELSGLPRAAVEAWPTVFSIAVDVPTGLNADTGYAAGPAIQADVTVAIQYAKRGYTAPEAARYLGRLVVADIGIPECCADEAAWEKVAIRE